MKTILKRTLAVALAFSCLLSAASALCEPLRVLGLDTRTIRFNDDGQHFNEDAAWYTTYLREHPEVELKITRRQPYRSTSSLMKALDSGKLSDDVFWLWSNKHDLERLMAEGYLADLSDNAELMELAGQMYPSITRAVSWDGGLYLMPISLMVADFMHLDGEAWASLGLTEEEKPASFTGLLDFLESWPGRFPEPPNVSLTPYWDAEHCDDKHAYTRWLVGVLVRQYAFGCEHQGRRVDFNTPQFLALLERCKAVGDALYGHDGIQERSLFYEGVGDFADLPGSFVPMRMTDDDPIFIPMEVIGLAVNPRSEHRVQAEEFAASYLRSMLACDGNKRLPTEEEYEMPRNHAALFAMEEPLISANVSGLYAARDAVAELKARLVDGTPEGQTRAETEAALAEQREVLAYYEAESPYILDADELARYRELTRFFYFRTPGGFDSRAGGTNDIRIRLARGKLTAEQYVKRLSRFVKQEMPGRR